jgi:hypothetical protein
MSMLAQPQLPQIQVKYPAVILDSTYGTQVQVQLKRTQGVVRYHLQIVEGTLNGGSAPAYNSGATLVGSPIITHVTVEADNTRIFDCDTPLWDQQNYLLSNGSDAADGLHHVIRMADAIANSGGIDLQATLLPTWKFNQIIMTLTINSLSAVTTGAPTSSTGTTLYITEVAVPRAAVTFTPHLVKKLQISTSITQAGDNDLTAFLSQTGAYKSLLVFTGSNSAFFDGNSAHGYGSGVGQAVVDYQQIKLNDLIIDKDTYTAVAIQALKAIYGVAPSTGYSGFVWMDDTTVEKMLNLANTKLVTAVDYNFHQPSASTTYIRALKFEYL